MELEPPGSRGRRTGEEEWLRLRSSEAIGSIANLPGHGKVGEPFAHGRQPAAISAPAVTFLSSCPCVGRDVRDAGGAEVNRNSCEQHRTTEGCAVANAPSHRILRPMQAFVDAVAAELERPRQLLKQVVACIIQYSLYHPMDSFELINFTVIIMT